MATQELRDKLYEDFLKEFPLESLKDMTLEKYTNRIKITSKGGEIVIEDICAVKEWPNQ